MKDNECVFMEKFVSGGSQTPGEDGVGAPLFLDQFRGPYGSTTEIIRVDQKAGANPFSNKVSICHRKSREDCTR